MPKKPRSALAPLRVNNLSKRTAGQRELDLVFIADLYVKGYPVVQIAHELAKARDYELTVQMIYNELKLIHRRWMESYLVQIDDHKAKELARIDALEAEYWQAWKRSQEKKEIIDTEKIEDTQFTRGGKEAANPQYTRTRVKKRVANVTGEDAYLAGIQWCIEMRCKILGLIQSTQNINVNWRKQAEEAGVDPDGVVDELVSQFVKAATDPTLGGSGTRRSLGSGSEDHPG